MIRLLKRNELNEEKYNDCIANSLQSRVYAYSWYLDIVADNWHVLVLNDYKAVMPLPIRKKMGITYVYPPFWLIELGVFSQEKDLSIDAFIEEVTKKYYFIETRLNTKNTLEHVGSNFQLKELQYLFINTEYKETLNQYQKDKKKGLKKAKATNLIEVWNDEPKKMIELFKENIGKRTPNINGIDYAKLLSLISTCIQKDIGEILSIYNEEKLLVASGFFLKHSKRVTLLVSSTDLANRNNGANTFLIDRAIHKYSNQFKTFHFGGSSIASIAKYFKGFGAKTETYFLLKKRLL